MNPSCHRNDRETSDCGVTLMALGDDVTQLRGALVVAEPGITEPADELCVQTHRSKSQTEAGSPGASEADLPANCGRLC